MVTCGKLNSDEAGCQPFPRTGRLRKALNVNLPTLRKHLARESADINPYVVRTVNYSNGRFIQTGSGPNFQGGLITLCTCKHQMRSWLDIHDWPGRWVAGFTRVGAVDRANYLVYLMKVGEAYASHQDLWSSSRLPWKTKKAKAAHLHSLGDMFQPNSLAENPFDYRSYVAPRSDHSHAPNNEWHKDIDYGSRRPAALLVGHVDFSFLWDSPVLRLPVGHQLPRNPSRLAIRDLLSQLEPGSIR